MRSLTLFLLPLLWAALQPAAAQSLILRPAAVPLKGEIGQSVQQALTLQNDSDLPLEFEVVAQDVVVRDGQRVFVEAGRIAGSIAATAVIEPKRVRVAARSSATATVLFTLPHGMQHRAAVALFKGVTPVQSGNRKATLSLGTLFTFAISDAVAVEGRLAATPPSGNTNGAFSSRLVNVGQEPVVPAGLAVVMDAKGRLVGKSAFAPKRLLPGESATLVADFPGDLDSGDYRAVATFDVAGKPLTLVSPFVVP